MNFFIRYSPVIYFLLVLGFLVGLQRFIQARRERREAVYGLELEIANRHAARAITALSLVAFIFLGEFVLTVILAPNLPASLQFVTPTINPLITPTDTFSPAQLALLQTATIGPTPTVAASGCIPGQISITSPKPGDELQGKITIQGTANIPNFAFFKYEYAPAGAGTWFTIEAGRTAIQDGNLGIWDTSASDIPPGDYQLRLVVVDNQGNELPACIVPVRIKAP
ncbi:MAG TPA: hypothetical protein VMC09_03365 [Anaerolineales bacterium]|nr:hypothetical protein [Anaerolineales bacterium]